MAIKFKTARAGQDSLNQLLQVMEGMSRIEDRKKDNVNSNLNQIFELSKYATNTETLDNVINQWQSQSDSASEYEETDVYHDLLGNVLKDRKAQINQYSNVVEQAEGIINNANFLDKEEDFVNLPKWIEEQVDEEGRKKYASTMEWVSEEYAKIESYVNTLDLSLIHI